MYLLLHQSMPSVTPEYAFCYTRVWVCAAPEMCAIGAASPSKLPHTLSSPLVPTGANWRFFKGGPIFSPVFDVHAPEVVVKEVEDRRLPESIFVRHNRRHVVVDEVSVDGVAVDDHRDEGDEGTVDKVFKVDETIGRLQFC